MLPVLYHPLSKGTKPVSTRKIFPLLLLAPRLTALLWAKQAPSSALSWPLVPALHLCRDAGDGSDPLASYTLCRAGVSYRTRYGTEKETCNLGSLVRDCCSFIPPVIPSFMLSYCSPIFSCASFGKLAQKYCLADTDLPWQSTVLRVVCS